MMRCVLVRSEDERRRGYSSFRYDRVEDDDSRQRTLSSFFFFPWHIFFKCVPNRTCAYLCIHTSSLTYLIFVKNTTHTYPLRNKSTPNLNSYERSEEREEEKSFFFLKKPMLKFLIVCTAVLIIPGYAYFNWFTLQYTVSLTQQLLMFFIHSVVSWISVSKNRELLKLYSVSWQ